MLLRGQPVADKIKNEIIEIVNECKNRNRVLPRLAILRVGNRQEDIAYESRIIKNCKELGIETSVTEMSRDVDMTSFIKVLEKLNEDDKTQGILVFRPLPEQLDFDVISRLIKAEKDIDCMNPINMEKVFAGDRSGMLPCTPEAVMEILKFYEIDFTGKNIAIINRSMVLGKPLAILLLNKDATVTLCHSKTKDLAKVTKTMDVVVTGIGKPKYFGKEFFNEDAIVIDVGINIDENGKLCGDVDFAAVSEHVASITPVPGGVGVVTSMVLLRHVIKAMRLQDMSS